MKQTRKSTAGARVVFSRAHFDHSNDGIPGVVLPNYTTRALTLRYRDTHSSIQLPLQNIVGEVSNLVG